MRFVFLYIIIGVSFIFGCKESSDPPGPDGLNPFLGKWRIMQYDTIRLSGAHYWTFGDTTITMSDGGFGTYSYNPAQFPPTIDLHFVGVESHSFLSIYQFVRTDSLIIKLNVDSLMRPTDFTIQDGYQVQQLLRQ